MTSGFAVDSDFGEDVEVVWEREDRGGEEADSRCARARTHTHTHTHTHIDRVGPPLFVTNHN